MSAQSLSVAKESAALPPFTCCFACPREFSTLTFNCRQYTRIKTTSDSPLLETILLHPRRAHSRRTTFFTSTLPCARTGRVQTVVLGFSAPCTARAHRSSRTPTHDFRSSKSSKSQPSGSILLNSCGIVSIAIHRRCRTLVIER